MFDQPLKTFVTEMEGKYVIPNMLLVIRINASNGRLILTFLLVQRSKWLLHLEPSVHLVCTVDDWSTTEDTVTGLHADIGKINRHPKNGSLLPLPSPSLSN